jgi:hypothetical protein
MRRGVTWSLARRFADRYHTTRWKNGDVRDLVAGSGLTFQDRAAALKGVPDEWEVFAALGA